MTPVLLAGNMCDARFPGAGRMLPLETPGPAAAAIASWLEHSPITKEDA